jgi:four helix bundle protein
LGPITEKLTGPGAKKIFGIRLLFAKVRPREANQSRSKKDFRNKIAICESEASETQYWLQVIAGVGWKSWDEKSWDELQPDYDECSELLAIFTSIGKN